jgi:hypothetical protein
MVLGLAYGLYEEGVVARSLFDANWSEMGSLAEYNHVAGVNWTYTEVLLHFHTTVSILASVALVQFLFPARRRESWISTRKLGWCFVGLLAWAPALASVQILADDPEFQFYFPPVGLFLLVLAGIAGCVVLARSLPASTPPSPAHPVRRPLAFGILGAVNMLVVFMAVFAVPELDSPPPLAMSFAFVLVFDAATIWLVARWSGNLCAWEDRHVSALVSGQLSFFIAFGVLMDFDEGFTGRTFVGIAAAYALWLIWRRIALRPKASNPKTSGRSGLHRHLEVGEPDPDLVVSREGRVRAVNEGVIHGRVPLTREVAPNATGGGGGRIGGSHEGANPLDHPIPFHD